ncbi:MAG: acyl-CoA dehydrogenase domain protein [Rhodoglobus sp.]|nr:acyl-CoA dehydrogenase domain protein [Rhodoglobus sp.]
MRLQLTPAQRAFQQDLRAFYEREVQPGWRTRYKTFEELGAYLLDWEKVLYRGNWSVPTWPAEFDGRGADAIERAIFTEETARFDAPEGLNRLGKRLVAPVLMRHGTDAQRSHLARIRSGEEVWCQGFSEPNAGSDLVNIRTAAVRDGSDWVINGRKIWTSFAQFADWVMLLVRTGAADSRAEGISIILVSLDTPGIEISPIQTIAGRSEFNEVSFDDVRVPLENLVGAENGGWPIVRSVLQDERGAEFCLARYTDIRRIFEDVTSYAKTDADRSYPGRIGADYARIYTIQLLASDLLDRGQRDATPEGLESMLKLYTTETWRSLGDDQVHYWAHDLFERGGKEGLEDYYESRHYTISAGTSEIQRNLIAGRLLQLPSSRRSAP